VTTAVIFAALALVLALALLLPKMGVVGFVHRSF
jgi:hypothetical protein